jgi:hypothetical protein
MVRATHYVGLQRDATNVHRCRDLVIKRLLKECHSNYWFCHAPIMPAIDGRRDERTERQIRKLVGTPGNKTQIRASILPNFASPQGNGLRDSGGH